MVLRLEKDRFYKDESRKDKQSLKAVLDAVEAYEYKKIDEFVKP